MELLISITDFGDYVPFSVNISSLLVNPHIRDAQTFDVRPLVPAAVWQALQVAVAAASPDFFGLEFDTLEFETLPAGPTWTDAQLATLWFTAVRPLLVCCAADRMLLWHGAHVTENGLESISDIGHQPVSAPQRAQLRADVQRKVSHYTGLLASSLRLASPRAASCAPRTRRPGPGSSISAV